jgi:hypothetical protein
VYLTLFAGIRAHEFVGQADSKSSSGGSVESRRGLNQHEQAEVLRRFNEGVFNVLLATSIAEEGLDIAEVALCHALLSILFVSRFVGFSGGPHRAVRGGVVAHSTRATLRTDW